jgi:chitin synthase
LAKLYLKFYFDAASLAGENAAAIPRNAGLYLFLIFQYIGTLVIAGQFILSLGNRPQGAKHLFMGSMILLGLVSAYASACSVFCYQDRYVGRKWCAGW